MDLDLIRKLSKPAETKVVLFVLDGLGGIPSGPARKTELESASTPNMDGLTSEGICGLHDPIGPGITPGSGPAHLSIFGYDPIEYQIGRGVLEALGVNFDLQPGDVAARGNFCTVDAAGLITDRRAGRIPTETNQDLCALLRNARLEGVELFVDTVKEHRLLVVLRGDGLSGDLSDTDPQAEGKKPLEPTATSPEAARTVDLVKDFVSQAQKILADQRPANMLTLRGFASRPTWPAIGEIYGLRAAAIASYPMYRGVGKLIGMEALETGPEIEDEFDTLERSWNDYDFFYFHVKKTDSYGENGDYAHKVQVIEKVDKLFPRLTALKPDVVVVTGDHSTPSAMKAHSWHPVPVLLWSPLCRPDGVARFAESACVAGGLGPRIAGSALMPLAMAHAGRIEKFGA